MVSVLSKYLMVLLSIFLVSCTLPEEARVTNDKLASLKRDEIGDELRAKIEFQVLSKLDTMRDALKNSIEDSEAGSGSVVDSIVDKTAADWAALLNTSDFEILASAGRGYKPEGSLITALMDEKEIEALTQEEKKALLDRSPVPVGTADFRKFFRSVYLDTEPDNVSFFQVQSRKGCELYALALSADGDKVLLAMVGWKRFENMICESLGLESLDCKLSNVVKGFAVSSIKYVYKNR